MQDRRPTARTGRRSSLARIQSAAHAGNQHRGRRVSAPSKYGFPRPYMPYMKDTALRERHRELGEPVECMPHFTWTSRFLTLRAVLRPIECGAFHVALRYCG